MTCEELRSELKKVGRSTSGKKEELQARLWGACQENDRGSSRQLTGESSWGDYLASGEHRDVWAGEYVKGPRRGEPSVLKVFKDGEVFESEFFEKDILAVQKAADIIEHFNFRNEGYVDDRDQAIPRVYLNKPEVWDYDGKKCLVEPRLLGTYHKFNSNTGWVQDPELLTEALSHYSYEVTGGQYLLCDLQGTCEPSHFLLTDPVVHSLTREFGVTDGGLDAMKSFFSRHKCNRFCDAGWKRAAHFGGTAFHAARSGTAFFLAGRR